MRRDGGSVFPAHANTVTQIGLLEAFPLMSARLRADIHDGPELSSNQRSDTLMQDRSPPTHRIFLLRTAGPYIWVKSRHRVTSASCPLYLRKPIGLAVSRLQCPVEESHEARVSLNSSGLTPTAASTAVSAASGVWLRRVLLTVAAFETLVGGLIDLAGVPDLDIINARLFIHPFLAIAALVLAARRYLRAAIVVLAAYVLAALAIGWSLDFALGGLSLLAQQVIFGPLAVTAIVLAILDKLLWLGAVFVAVPSANLLLGMIPLILFTIGVMIYGAAP